MVYMMITVPPVVRGENQQPRENTYDGVQPLCAEERPVAAVMKDDECPHKKTRLPGQTVPVSASMILSSDLTIRYHNNRYGPTEFITCHQLLR
ncbi:MAG: hypothetical protein MZV63_32335 [Marinilabiliales bacterium]|nr:hypothetical protein [Marinilabiliales bacterium]